MKLAAPIMALAIACTPLAALAANPKPFTVPEVKTWTGADGSLTLGPTTRIIVASPDLMPLADQFASDYAAMFGSRPEVATGKAKPGDIVMRLKADKKLGEEGYRMTIGKNVEITAPTVEGARWATRTLLQMREASTELPKGTVTDDPSFGFRGFMIDCGRKYIPMDYLRQLVDVLAYYKMNKLHIHLNDNGFKYYFDNDWDKTQAAFRMESDLFPGLTARDGSYSKQEFRDLQAYALSKGVEIIPEIDFPAHSLAFTRYRPEIGSTDGEYGRDHLDLMKDETYSFLDSLITEYIGGPDPVFTGKRFHIGTDEYSNRDSAVVEKFRYMTDRYIRLTEENGKTPIVWGALTHAKGNQPVKADGVEMYLWYNGYANPQDMLDAGYKVISIPDGYVYIVPEAGYYYDYLNTRMLYDKWDPSVIADVKVDPKNPQLMGGAFAVWNDHPGNGITVKDIHHRVMDALPTMASKTWSANGELTRPYDEFRSLSTSLSEAPGVNYLGRQKPGTVLELAEVAPGSKTGLREIGYGYAVEFDIEGADEKKGTVLFESPDATVWLSDPITGFMGFSREDKLYQFRQDIRPGEKHHIRIEGDNRATKLYVDGRLVDDLNVIRNNFTDEKDRPKKMAQVRTLVFPLEKAGNFRSRVTNLRVTAE